MSHNTADTAPPTATAPPSASPRDAWLQDLRDKGTTIGIAGL